MNLTRNFAVAAALLGSVCATADGAAPLERKIDTYPFVASPERAAAIRSNYKRVALGMSPAEVAAILGDPDETLVLYEPQPKNGKVVGYTQWYVLQRLVRNGSVNQKQESLVRVSFGNNDRVSKIDAWGL